MKSAILIADSVQVICPECAEAIPDPKHGSLFWTTDQYHDGEVIRCPDCGAWVRLPKTVRMK